MMSDSDRRLLGAFIRARREAMTPPAAVPPARRRTPGLRREEVAQLSGLSTTWYSWIEQGRDISLSAAALARLAAALGLTAAERAYLFELARRHDPAAPEAGPSIVPPELAAVLEAVAAPAYLLDPDWSARGWNAAAGALFAPWFGSGEACLLRYVFLDPGARGFIVDWEERARRLVAEFRADMPRAADGALRDIAADLARRSPDFARLWTEQAVLARVGGIRAFRHPTRGRTSYRQVTLQPSLHPGWKVVMLLPR